MRQRLRLALLGALSIAAIATAAQAGPRILGGGKPTLSPGAVVVGQAVTATGAPVGATCQWLLNGSAISGATSCSAYTPVSAGTLSLRVTFGGVTVTSSGVAVGTLDLSQPNAVNGLAAVLGL